MFKALIDLFEALVHIRLQRFETLVRLREPLEHQLPLMPQLLFDPNHPLAQLDLVDGRRLAQRLLGQPLSKVLAHAPGVGHARLGPSCRPPQSPRPVT